ncbi:MAG: hypothetical protein JWQ09_3587 [Segetibacter sp.]|nr:hypothetical protein [Segetibacter sp.]
MTTPEQNKELVVRFNKEFIENKSIQAFKELIAPDFVNQTAPPGVPKGPEGVLYFFNEFLRPAFPDLTVEIYDQVAEDDKVATRKAFHATHKGVFLGVPASDKKVIMQVIDIVRLRDGKFIEHWNVLDLQSIMMQIQN